MREKPELSTRCIVGASMTSSMLSEKTLHRFHVDLYGPCAQRQGPFTMSSSSSLKGLRARGRFLDGGHQGAHLGLGDDAALRDQPVQCPWIGITTEQGSS